MAVSIFQGEQPRQIWVGAGIGIYAIHCPHESAGGGAGWRTLTCFIPTAVYDDHAIGLMTRDAQAAGVRLHWCSGASATAS